MCPVCKGVLTAFPDKYKQLFPAVNLFAPRDVRLVTCLTDAEHRERMKEAWDNVLGWIRLWLYLTPVGIELGPDSSTHQRNQ